MCEEVTFIVGGGPSARALDLEEMKGQATTDIEPVDIRELLHARLEKTRELSESYRRSSRASHDRFAEPVTR